jgi:hypothetical protein
MDDIPATDPTDFEREKWQTEVEFRRREFDLREREQERLAAEAERSRWWNPLFIAIVGATIAAAGGAVASWLNGNAAQQAEAFRAESARILEAIKANDPDKAKENLRFLVATGLVSGPTAGKVKDYLDKQPAGRGPFLPSAFGPSIDVETMKLKRLIDKGAQTADMIRQLVKMGGMPGASYETALEVVETIGGFSDRCTVFSANPQLRQEVQKHGGFDTPEINAAAAKALDCP